MISLCICKIVGIPEMYLSPFELDCRCCYCHTTNQPNKNDQICTISAYGSVVGSCAMSFLPKGGVYITGGLLLNLLRQENPVINTEKKAKDNGNFCDTFSFSKKDSPSPFLTLFLNSYGSKGDASFLLNDIPLYVVLAEDTGLRGAAIRAGMACFE